MGRPKVWNPEELAVKLDEWSKRDDSQWLGDFLIEIECGNHQRLSEWAQESEIFRTSLQLAKYRIASRNRKALHAGLYNSVQFQREIGMYDALLKAHDREEKEYEASLKRADEDPYTPEQAKALASVLNAVSKYQDQARAANNPPSPGDSQAASK